LRRNRLPKHVIEGRIEVTGGRGGRGKQLLEKLRKREDAGNWKRKHLIALRGELALEEAMDLS
jgi:hypothetical protein